MTINFTRVSELLKKSAVISFSIASLVATLAVPTTATAAAFVTINSINGQPAGGHCLAGTLTLNISGMTGDQQGGPYHLVVGNGTSTTTPVDIGTKNTAFNNLIVVFTPSGTGSSLLVNLYHGSPTGNDSHITLVNQCIPPATKGVLTVSKQVVGGSSIASDFTMQVTGGTTSVTPFAGSTTGTDLQLLPGTYTVGEAANSSYTPSVSCTNVSDNTPIVGSNVTLLAGKNYACTVTNTYVPPVMGTLRIVKEVVGDVIAALSSFILNVEDENEQVVASGPGSTGTDYPLLAGEYTVTEAPNPHYTPNFGNCGSNGSVTVTAGTTTCTVVNTFHNTAPVAVADDEYTTPEDAPLNIAAAGVLTNDTDGEGDTLTAAVVAGPAHGVLDLETDGSFVYTPAANFNGEDTFTYRVSDGFAFSEEATVTITVTPVNDAPVAFDDTENTNEDSPVTTGNVLDNDQDIENDTLFVSDAQATSTQMGTVVNNTDGTFTYTPPANFHGVDTFTYVVSDGQGGEDTGTVTINVSSDNDAPTADSDSYELDEDGTLVIAAPGVLGNDNDTDDDDLSANLVGDGPAHGDLTLNSDGSFTYTPDLNFVGTDSFMYCANDGSVCSSTVTVTITVNPINDAPVAVNDSYSTEQNVPVLDGALTASDVDDGDTLTYATTTSPANGTITLFDALTGLFTYVPNNNFFGTDSFDFTADDGEEVSNVATITINVTDSPENDIILCSNGEDDDNDEDVDLADEDCERFIPRLTLEKVAMNDDEEVDPSSWTLKATGATTTISGVTGGPAVTGAKVAPGVYTLTEEEGLDHYAQQSISCTFNRNNEAQTTVDGSSVTLLIGDNVFCIFTNTFTPYTSDLSVTKTVSDEDGTVDVDQSLTYTITVSNAGPDAAQNVVVSDLLPAGLTYVSDNGAGSYNSETGVWTVGHLSAGGEGSSASLQIVATVSGIAGTTITNTASVSSENADDGEGSNSGSSTVTVSTPPTPEEPPRGGGGGSSGSRPTGSVLGASAGQVLGESCGLYMDQYLKRNNPKNNPGQVTKLQAFLNKHAFGTFAPTGFFGPLTEAAVKAFQAKYANEILVPWKISAPTGLAYLTTLRQVNLIECPELMIPVPTLIDWNKNPAVK